MRKAVENRRRLDALLLASLFLLMLLTAVGVTFAETGHHCTGIDCAVCQTILHMHALLMQLTLPLLAAQAIPVIRALFRRAARGLRSPLPPRTPVSLRTRMND